MKNINTTLSGKFIARLVLAFIILSTFFTSSCKKDPEIPEIDPIFQEKKRPPYNEVVMAKIKSRENDGDYQEVNPNFANEYQDAQREFEKSQNQNPSTQDIIKTQSEQKEYKPLTVQKIRDDSASLGDMQKSQLSNTSQDVVQPSAQPSVQQLQVQNAEIFEIQAGSFKSEEGASIVAQKFKDAGINARIDKVGDINFVRIVGSKPFTTRSEASKYLQEVIDKTQHYDIMVIRK